MRKSLTAVIWTPPLDADVEFVAGRHVGSQRHTLVVDVLFVSYPNLTECAWWDLETQIQLVVTDYFTACFHQPL